MSSTLPREPNSALPRDALQFNCDDCPRPTSFEISPGCEIRYKDYIL